MSEATSKTNGVSHKNIGREQAFATVISVLCREGVGKSVRKQVFDRNIPDDELPDLPVVRAARRRVRAVREQYD